MQQDMPPNDVISKKHFRDLLARPEYKDEVKKAVVATIMETTARFMAQDPKKPMPTDPRDLDKGELENLGLGHITMPNLDVGKATGMIPVKIDYLNKVWADQAQHYTNQTGKQWITPLESMIDDIFFDITDDDEDGTMKVTPIFGLDSDQSEA
ncbi:hypothetical protein LGQ03_04940 [Loktanella sp. TSTF-M6]|uniref:Uncharacterized protein n=1 Tax=Loktanella gaetbuli TaxID=2881335 RepID=A0ABS8BSI3_9RHOB|nr:hypothetical protein [Loktanella gaetbuli]MCB5198577.1 hypothetical protein [Loktanella gaetbuli]